MYLSSYRMALALALLLPATQAAAGEWSGKLGGGAIATSGNAENSSLQVELGLAYKRGIWHNRLSASATHARSEAKDESSGQSRSRTTSERYVVGLRTALDFSEADFVFLQLDFEKDLFGGIRERTVETLGYGRRLLRMEKHQLDLELGAGARQLRAQGAGARRESELVGRSGLNYRWQITETSSFAQTITLEGGEDNIYTESVSGLKLSVIGGVFANLGLTVKNNSEVPAGTEKTDIITSVSLSYEF